ncbi:MAG: polysaccharide pyruvyl transferase family protein [Clostridia bacterium]|nr:polysaccharide pyruvyl transferase family protein [Clostridia bacterium]
MLKTGILTFQKSLNYGSALQAWALQEKVCALGADAELIDYTPDHYADLYGYLRRVRSAADLRYDLGNLPFIPLLRRRKKAFQSFWDQRFRLSEQKYAYPETPERLNDRYEAIICGSDQIWSSRAKDADVNFFLPIGHKAKKISYAPSLNDGSIADFSPAEDYRRYLSDFDCLSVREADAKADIEAFLGGSREIAVLPDPTLLHPKEAFEKIAEPSGLTGEYLLFFSVNYNRMTVRAVKTVARRTGLPVYFYFTGSNAKRTARENKDFHLIRDRLSPACFLDAVKNASRLVCDSFHGTAFSVIFEKPFFCIARQAENGGAKRDARICGLLEQLGLSDRFISEVDAETVDLETPIDYTGATEKRKAMAEYAETWLRAALS